MRQRKRWWKKEGKKGKKNRVYMCVCLSPVRREGKGERWIANGDKGTGWRRKRERKRKGNKKKIYMCVPISSLQ